MMEKCALILVHLLHSLTFAYLQTSSISNLPKNNNNIIFTVESLELKTSPSDIHLQLMSIGHLDSSKNISAVRNEIILSTKLFALDQVIIQLYPNDLPQLTFILLVLNSVYKQSYKTTLISWWKPKFLIKLPHDFIQEFQNESTVIKQIATLLFQHSILIPIDSEIYFLHEYNYSALFAIECYTFKALYKCQNMGVKTALEASFLVTDIERIHPVSARRQNLSGVELVAVAQNDPDYQPRVKIRTLPNGKQEFVDGMCFKVLLALKLMLGFSYSALEGRGWTGLFPNGTWTGMSGQVVNGEADISISQASTIMMTDQLHGISFLHPTSVGYVVAIFRQPKAIGLRDVASRAFQLMTWLTLLAEWILIIICLRVAFKISRYNNQPDRIFENDDQLFPGTRFQSEDKGFLDSSDNDYEDDNFITDSVWWAVSTACCISWHYSPSSVSLRFMSTVGYFQAILVFVGFSAAIVTRLFNEEIPIQNFERLQASKIDMYADMWLPMTHQITHELYQKRGQLKKVNLQKQHIQLESAIPRILSRPWGFITFQDAITVVFHRLNYSDVYFCNTVYTVRASPVAFSNAMFVRKGHPLKEIMNPRIVAMIERGVMSRMNSRYDILTTTRCPDRLRQYRGGFSLYDVASQFVVLISGFILSSFALLGEKFHISKIMN